MKYLNLVPEINANGTAIYPLPFPGKYPTRIYAWWNNGTRNHPHYAGKPSRQAFDWIKRHLVWASQARWDRMYMMEVDQGGYVNYNNGGNIQRTLWADSVYPIPTQLVQGASRMGRHYIMFHRKLVSIDGRSMWVVPDLWGKSPQQQPYVAWVKNCSKGRLRQTFDDRQVEPFFELVEEKARIWGVKPQAPNPLPQGRQAEYRTVVPVDERIVEQAIGPAPGPGYDIHVDYLDDERVYRYYWAQVPRPVDPAPQPNRMQFFTYAIPGEPLTTAATPAPAPPTTWRTAEPTVVQVPRLWPQETVGEDPLDWTPEQDNDDENL